MSNKKKILSFLAVLLGLEVLLGAFGYLTAYLQIRDEIGVLATASYILQQLLTALPLFLAIGVAFYRVSKRGLASALGVLTIFLPFSLVYQTSLTFLDYYFLQENLFGTSLLLGLLNGLYAGVLSGAILFSLLFFIPYALFLRGKQSDGESGGVYAALSAMLVLLLYGLLEETAALLMHLSENFWIIYPSEILSFVLFCLLRIAVCVFGFFAIRYAEKKIAKLRYQ
jgi:hypothetical protein